MKEYYLFQVNEWNHKWFTSADNLWQASIKTLIDVEKKPTEFGCWYTFTTKEGVLIARIYKDSTFGFSGQAFGVQVPSPYALFPKYKKYLDDRFDERQQRIKKATTPTA